nr:NADH dehydrogenase subunit 4 [Haematoloechus sp. CW13H]
MAFKSFIDFYFFLIVLFASLFIGILFLYSSSFCVGFCDWVIWGDYFWFDSVSFYLGLLSIVLWLVMLFLSSSMSVFTIFVISLSILCSVLSYSCVHSLLFWGFYEVSIFSLLLLLILDSPYSERYLAVWYLGGYMFLTGLPMLAILLYFSFLQGTFLFVNWDLDCDFSVIIMVILSILFMTKIPLFPFHSWLPVVHAEASSVVSICLSGYVMKLGFLGILRVCYVVLPDYVFSCFYYLLLLGVCVIFFFVCISELDGKRWLAFLSLCHMITPVSCFSFGFFDGVDIGVVYCLGHGVAAGLIFVWLWLLSDISGSRNWLIIKNYISGFPLVRFLCVMCFGVICSLPPLVQFFCEVSVVLLGLFYGIAFIVLFSVYLFCSGVVPLILLGTLLSNHYSVSYTGGFIYSGVNVICLLLLWSFFMFLII